MIMEWALIQLPTDLKAKLDGLRSHGYICQAIHSPEPRPFALGNREGFAVWPPSRPLETSRTVDKSEIKTGEAEEVCG